MVRMQIVERDGARLFETLKDAMRSGDLRTFELKKHGRKITHKSADYHGWINWDSQMGVITCEILSPKMGDEWKLLSSFVGRLANRFSGLVQSVNIQFEEPAKARRR